MNALTIETPIGPLRAEFDEVRVNRIAFHATGGEGEDPHNLRERFGRYFAGDGSAFDDLPIDEGGTEFQRRAWSAMRAIPFGETLTYGELAERMGCDRSTYGRAIGAACGANPLPIITPCHRVMGSSGKLTGFGGGVETKRRLLEHEGAPQAADCGRLC